MYLVWKNAREYRELSRLDVKFYERTLTNETKTKRENKK